jgi:hypothetical protein
MRKILMRIVTNALELPTIWYHGTMSISAASISRGVDLSKGPDDPKSDFGPGFYLTTNLEQAKKWAKGKADHHNDRERGKANKDNEYKPRFAHPSVVTFELDREALAQPHIVTMFFEVADEAWGEFILGNRCTDPDKLDIDFHNQNRVYDSVYGPLADGAKIRTLVRKTEKSIITGRGTMTKEQFIEEVRTGFPFPQANQLSIHSTEALECFAFRGVINVVESKEMARHRR